MNHNIFNEKMKLADLILMNYRLLYVFPCFNIELGFGDSTIKQLCEKKGISISLFLLVCNVYTFDHYRPSISVLKKIPLSELMTYLRKSHKDYLENRMPHIINQIYDLINCCNFKYGDMLMQFCEKYKEEVIAHFEYEEQIAFPYIASLLKGETTKNYSIEQYEESHSNINSALNDLKNIIIKYLPNEYTIERCRNVLIDIFLFESDLNKHTLLEDKILISLVEQIEKEIQ